MKQDLTNDETKAINRLVEPFVENEWGKDNPTAVGGTDRGVVITCGSLNGSKILVRLYRIDEEIPEA